MGQVSVVVGSGPQNINSKSEAAQFSYVQDLVLTVLDTTAFYKLTKGPQVEIESWTKKTQTRNLSVLAGTNQYIAKAWFGGLESDTPIEPKSKVKCKQLVNDIFVCVKPTRYLWLDFGSMGGRIHALPLPDVVVKSLAEGNPWFSDIVPLIKYLETDL